MTVLKKYQRSCTPGLAIGTPLYCWLPKHTVAVLSVIYLCFL